MLTVDLCEDLVNYSDPSILHYRMEDVIKKSDIIIRCNSNAYTPQGVRIFRYLMYSCCVIYFASLKNGKTNLNI